MIQTINAPPSRIKLPSPAKWMMMKQRDVFDKFYGQPGAFTDGTGLERFVWIEGWRDDRVILIAHADTVWPNCNIDVDYHNGILFSKLRTKSVEIKSKHCTYTKFGIGIGADDRAGCNILWELRELGHSLLITGGEECGCIASNRIAVSDWWRKKIAEHQFAVQFDRRGCNDIVFYNVGTNSFVNYVQKSTGFIPQAGTNTDIRVLCKDICGVNMSVGYYNEHMPDERLDVGQWMNTLQTAKTWLSQPKLPKFPLVSSDIYDHGEQERKERVKKWALEEEERKKRCEVYRSQGSYGFQSPIKKTGTTNPNKAWLATSTGFVETKAKATNTPTIEDKNRLLCPACTKSFNYDVIFNNKFKCPDCQHQF